MVGPKRKNERYYRLLARTIMLVVIGVSFVPLVLTNGFILNQFGTAYREKIYEHLDELVQKHSQNIDGFLTDRLGDIRVLSRSYDLWELNNETFLRRRLSLLREEYGGVYVDLGLIDSQGIQAAYAGPFRLTAADYSAAEWFQAVLAREYYISDVFMGLRGSPHFIIGVKQHFQGRDWIIRATIDFEAFNSLVENIHIGRTGFAFILNRQGDFQTKSRKEVLLTREPYSEYLKSGADPKKTTIVEGIDEQGVESIVAMAPLKGGQWLLCCQQESADAFASLRRTQILALFAFIISGFGIVVVAFLLSKRMVSSLAQADQEKSVMNEKVIEAGRLASIGELAAGIAHEINNPVAIMVEEAGWIEDLLEDEDQTNEENQAELRRAAIQIKTQGRRCKEITHKLLSFARKTDPTVHEVNLNDLLADVTSLLKQKTRYANVKIETNLNPNLPLVGASPSELQQVLLNLVNNAIDAVDNAGGGSVTLTTRTNKNSVFIEVADTGPGIPESDLNRIFDPFFTTKPVGQGTGLGLSICYGIVNKLGGDITVRSQRGVGSVFSVRLPITGPSTQTAGESPSAGEPTRLPISDNTLKEEC